MTDAITLTQLLTQVKQELEKQFLKPYWVRAEVLEIKEHSSGHCYLELVEKDPQTQYLGARISASIWSNTYRMVKPYFESVVGRPLESGMQLLIKAKVQFHPLYGMSLVIADIEPNFTLGDIRIQKMKVLRRLEEEGLLDMNAALDFPLLPFKIAVISSENAAGFQDFSNELQLNPFAYRFNLELFPAIMQGAESEMSMMQAIKVVYDRYTEFDVLVIVRGGGAQADMHSFNGYDLASYIAQFPLPVITGIGHDKDKSVADEVAYLSLKTPTAVAGYLVAKIKEQADLVASMQSRLQNWLLQFKPRQTERLDRIRQTIQQAVMRYLMQQKNQLDQLGLRIKANDPQEVFKKGYSLVENDRGEKVRSVQQLDKGALLHVFMKDGQVITKIEETYSYAQEKK